MNRKLHNTILAFSVTGVMLFVGLIVAEPALPQAEPLPPSAMPAIVETPDQAHPDDHAPAARIQARAQAMEAELARATHTGEAIALGASLAALGIADAALAAALEDLDDESATGTPPRVAERKPTTAKRKSSASRDLIAVPYFSFARGSRGGRS